MPVKFRSGPATVIPIPAKAGSRHSKSLSREKGWEGRRLAQLYFVAWESQETCLISCLLRNGCRETSVAYFRLNSPR